MSEKGKTFFLFLLEVISLSLFFWKEIVRNQLSDRHFSFSSFILSLALIVIILGSLLYSIINLYARILTSKTSESAQLIKRMTVLSLSPFLLLSIIFLQQVIFLKDIRLVVVIVSISGFAYLHFLFLFRLKRRFPSKNHAKGNRIKSIFFSLNQKQTAMLVLAIAFLVYLMAASGLLFSPYPITGDEPHYLIITKSLLSDRDINLSNNYKNKDYLEFYPGEMDSHARIGKKGPEFQYSRHMPGLSLLLIPSYFLGSEIGEVIASVFRDPEYKRKTLIFMSRLLMCILAAALSGVFYLTAIALTGNQAAALLSWVLFSFSTPFLFYSNQIYPEVTVSLILALIFWLLLKRLKWTPLRLVLAGIGIGILPWFGIKYLMLFVGCYLLFFFSMMRMQEKVKKFLFISLPIFLFSLLFLFYLRSLYGKFSPQAIYIGTVLDATTRFPEFFHLNPVEFFRCGLGYLFDQRIGIFAYSPVYLLFIPGVILWLKKDKTEGLSLLFVFIVYWAFCSMGYYWGGYSPPGRTLLPVLWIMALFMAGAFTQIRRIRPSVVIYFLVALTFLNAFLLAQDTRLLYHENLSFSLAEQGKFSKLLASISNAFIDFRKFVPSLSNKGQIFWIPLIVWLSASLLLTYLFLKKRKETSRTYPQKKSTQVISVFVLSMAVVLYAFFNIRLDEDRAYKSKNFRVYFQDTNTYGYELDGFWIKGKSSTEVVVESPARVTQITLSLSSPVEGRTIVQVGNSKKSVNRKSGVVLMRAIAFPSPIGFAWRGRNFYRIKIREESGFVPNKLDKKSKDSRFLGVFVQIK